MKKLLILFLTIASVVTASDKKTLQFGLSLSNPKLETEINTALSTTDYEVKITTLWGHDKKRLAVLQNKFDILEGGFHSFHEFSKRRDAKVLLHAWYFKTYSNDMFHITGDIITHKDNDISLADIPRMNVFAKSDFSASGYYLQKLFLNNQGINFKAPTFTNRSSETVKSIENDKYSVGFVPSFEAAKNESKVKVIGRSKSYPAGLIFADRVIPQEVQDIIAKTTMNHFVHLREEKANVNRIYVTPLYDDYREKFSYEVKIFPLWQTISGVLVLLAMSSFGLGLIFHKNKTNAMQRELEATREKDLPSILRELNIHNEYVIIKDLIQSKRNTIDAKDLQQIEELLDSTEALVLLIGTTDKKLAKEKILSITHSAEELLKRIILMLNKLGYPQKELLGGNKIRLESTFMPNVEKVHAFCGKVRKAESQNQLDSDISKKIGQTRYISSDYLLLGSYRNDASHPGYCPTQENRLAAIFTSFSVLRPLLESELFVTD